MAEISMLRRSVVAGVLSALSIALFLTPFGYIPWLAGASLTVMHAAIIGAVLEGPVVGIIVGGIFGVSALIKAATAPQGPIDVFFVDPLVSGCSPRSPSSVSQPGAVTRHSEAKYPRSPPSSPASRGR